MLARHRYRPLPLAALLLLAAAEGAWAQVPQQAAIFPAGGQAGTTPTITISGANLQGASAILVSGTGVTAKITKNTEAAALPVELAIAADAEVGSHEVRVVTPRGTSNARRIYVDLYPTAAETEPNNAPAQATALTKFPITLHGQINGGEDVDLFGFEAAQGETWVFDLNGARHRSAIDGFLSLRDEQGHELKTVMEVSELDPRLVYTFPRAGKYVLLVRDKLYRGGANFTYAVNVGKLPVVTATMPLGGKQGETVEVALEGFNLGDKKSEKIQLPAEAGSGSITMVPKTAAGPANPVRLYVGAFPEAVEAEPNNASAQATKVPAPPVTLNGRIGQDGDVDVYTFPGQANQQLVFELWGRRLNSRLDSVIRILDKDGKELTTNDDAIGKDSRLAFTVPAAGDYQVEVGSLDRHGGLDYFYRLEIKPPPPADFTFTVTPDNPNIGPGGSVAMTVNSARAGYNGEIAITAEGLPAGVTVSPALIRAGQNQAVFTLTAANDAAIAMAPLKIVGKATIDGKEVVRVATPAETVTRPGADQPTLVPVVMNVASVTEQQQYALQVEPRTLTIKQGQTVEITLKALRKMDFKGAITIAVLNNQLPAGVQAQVKPIPQDQGEVKFNLVAADNAAAATTNLVFTGNANNVVQSSGALTVTVAPK